MLIQSINSPVPKWCPPGFIPRISAGKKKRRRSFRFDRAERRSMRKRPPIPVSEWAEQHRVLTQSVIPGPRIS
ncbi:hypothetical protein [Desulfosarcina ovata]|uniref:Uncharacterized protein n=1 Tax=Desulfosarcina ovata subsp. ovata TaxID=2752305 RepID=A0A5K8AB08_9BACT|nr:hypothetical protein [Desulfosarcina ovata]BBO89696.1 hypothetical protein DSCOOX_28760 [Desulfosarcina ovata subsp. ovata]